MLGLKTDVQMGEYVNVRIMREMLTSHLSCYLTRKYVIIRTLPLYIRTSAYLHIRPSAHLHIHS